MKGTFFSADFITDSQGNNRLMEVNTDTACVSNAIQYLDWNGFIGLLSGSSITEVHAIYKDFQEDIITSLSQSLVDNASFITTFYTTLEDSSTIYPSSITDSDNKFILRFFSVRPLEPLWASCLSDYEKWS